MAQDSRRVKVGGFVLARVGIDTLKGTIEKLTVISTGRTRPEAELFLVRQLYKISISVQGRTMDLPGSAIEDVL